MTDGCGLPALEWASSGGAAAAPEGFEFLDQARSLIARYLADSPAAIDVIIFWSLHAWAHARFAVSPRLVFHGRDVRADHARALRVVQWLAPRPRLIVRTSSAQVFNLLAHERATLLFDDSAGAILSRRDMRTFIAAGARRDGLFLNRRTKGGAGSFLSCAAPLALATSRSPPDDVLTHAIVVPMAPAIGDNGRAVLDQTPDEVVALRAAFQAFAERLANQQLIAPAPPSFLAATAQETWAPLFALAHVVGGDAPAAMLAAASQFGSVEHLEPPTSPLSLLRDVRRVAGIDDQPLPSKFLVEQLTRDPDSPWVACDWGAKITPRGIAQRLARFDLKPQVIYPPNAMPFRGYKAEALHVAFARYLNDPVALAFLRGAVAADGLQTETKRISYG